MTPETSIFAFDLHRVLFYRDFYAMLKYFRTMHNKKTVLKLLFNPKLWAQVMRLKRRTVVGDEIYNELATQFKELSSFAQDFINLENMHVPDYDVVTIVRELKQKGFRLYILSNIGERALADLSQKFSEIRALFDDVYVPSKKILYQQKPQLSFYQGFIQYIAQQGDGNKRIVFIDDKKENVQAAITCGISGILFQSAEGLRNVLQEAMFKEQKPTSTN